MMADLFSSFDPGMSSLHSFSPHLFWGGMFLFTIFLSPLRFIGSSRVKLVWGLVMGLGLNLVKNCQVQAMAGAAWLLVSVFFFLLCVNLSGLIPWAFSLSSHLIFSLSLALPLWVMSVLVAFSSNPVGWGTRLVTTGMPSALAPVVSVVEIVSVLVRPVTLAVRLSANMTCGHLLLGVVSAAFMGPWSALYLVAFGALTVLYLFEWMVGVLQAYVFTLLVGLYLREWVNDQA